MSKNLITQLFDNTGFTALFSAIIGSIVGSVSGYLYNKRLEQRRSNAGHWVNRKESIYSPLYAQALALKEYLDEVSSWPRPFAHIAIIEGRAYSKQICDFTLWYSIKRDVRFDYIPDHIKKDLDDLYAAVEARDKNEQEIYAEFKALAEKFYNTNQQLFDEAKSQNVNVSGSLDNVMSNIILPFQPNADTSVDIIVSLLQPWLKTDVQPELIKEKSEKLIEAAKQTKSYAGMRPTLERLQAKCDKTVKDLRKLITKIIQDYEGGVNIKL